MYQFFRDLNVRYLYGSIFVIMLLCVLNIRLFSDEIHTVKNGETLYQISKQYGISIDTLASVNGIDDASLIIVGMSIVISDEYDSQSERYQSYDIEKGDTLYGIAYKFDVSIGTIRELNMLSNDNLYVGQVLKLPYSATDAPEHDKKNITVVAGSTTSFIDSLKKEETKNIAHLFVNAIPSGTVSEQWPVSGKSYELHGKIPGIIIEGNKNATVKSISAGIVLYASFHSSFSNVIIIRGNDGTVYVYGGQGEMKVKQGDYVKVGQAIGSLGLMPLLQTPILYFSIWKNNRFINPNKFIS